MGNAKHVIFLGAGASKGSGYPLANELRLLMSSRNHWRTAVFDYVQKLKTPPGSNISARADDYWGSQAMTLDLFRRGGFATLDEFCKLAGPRFQSEINSLRCMMRAALGLFNPEYQFEKSEYYSLVQSVFNPDLVSLREDLAILTYNYDPYLEFLLWRALDERRRITTKGRPFEGVDDPAEEKEHARVLNSVTSGFCFLTDHSWLEKEGFCVLQLHGSICYPASLEITYDTLFQASLEERVDKLFGVTEAPPVQFPWEVMGNLGGDLEPAGPLSAVWLRAKREVQQANKISFVGLSMHPYLFDGLSFLFSEKEGTVEVCVANPDSVPDKHLVNQPHSTANAVATMLGKVAPKMNRLGGVLTIVEDLKDFIRTQMNPVRG